MVRKPRITPELTAAICANLKRAMPIKYSAEAEGVSETTVHEWIERGKAGQPLYAAFAEAVTRARATALQELTDKALEGGKGSSFAAWFIERRYRADYGPIQKVEVSGPEGSAVELSIDPIANPAARALLEAALGRETQPG